MSWADRVKGGKSTVSAPTNATPGNGQSTAAKANLNEDFPALPGSNVQTKPEPESRELATSSKEPTVSIKRGSGDGDHLEANVKPKAEAGVRDRQPYNGGAKRHDQAYDKQPRRADGPRPRTGSNQEGDWSKTHYYKQLDQETAAYRQKFQTEPPKTIFKKIEGDLFDADNSFSLAHCVSLDYAMSAGIAKIFKIKFAKTDQDIEDLKAQKQDIGGCSFQKRNDRFIFYLVTKKFYYAKPLYSDLEKSLTRLRQLCEANGVKSLAMPEIASGLDKLERPLVESLINQVFAGSDINMVIYEFKPADKPRPAGSSASSRSAPRKDNYRQQPLSFNKKQ